jgi:sulfur carrier protein ThiS
MSEQASLPTGPAGMSSQITLSLKLFCDLRRYVQSEEADIVHVQAPAGLTAEELLRHLHFDSGERVLFAINGTVASGDTVLRDGDDLMLFRPVQGE